METHSDLVIGKFIFSLINRKNIPVSENNYYLRKYVEGPTKKAIESYFLLGSESAYHAAWAILEESYGNPFVIAKAFRDKLNLWPKIGPKDSVELREFTDFLRGCEASMAEIKSLQVLNDCNENQKILSKLPDWLASRLSRFMDLCAHSVFVYVGGPARCACQRCLVSVHLTR